MSSLDGLCDDIGDVNHKMPKAQPDGIPYISTEDFLPEGEIGFDNAKKITCEDYEELCIKIKPEFRDIILTRYGTIGEVRLVETDREFQSSYATAIIKPTNRTLSDDLVCALASYQVKQQIEKYVRATAQPNLGLTHIRQFAIPIPPLEEQKELMRCVDSAIVAHHKLLQAIASSEAELKQLDQSILSKAFRGELVPQDPNDEPASELLAGIRATRDASETKIKRRKPSNA